MVRRRHARKTSVGTIVIGGCQEYKNEEENAWCKWVKQNALMTNFMKCHSDFGWSNHKSNWTLNS